METENIAKNLEALKSFFSDDITLYNQLISGVLNYALGRYDVAFESLNPLSQVLMDESGICGEWLIVSIMVHLLVYHKEFDKAILFCNSHLELVPDNEEAFNKLAIIHYQLKNYEGAYSYTQKALALSPKNHTFLGNEIEMLGWLGRVADMVVAMEQLMEEMPTYNPTFKLLALILRREGECDGCGGEPDKTCCKDMRLTYDGQPLKDPAALKLIVLEDSRNDVWSYHRKDDKGDCLFSCGQMDSNARCLIHPDRPTICRDFPKTFVETATFKSCSYSFRLVESIPLITNKNLQTYLVDSFKKYGLADDAKRLEQIFSLS
jgi:tetratricopeptide (TPR) repeat protein